MAKNIRLNGGGTLRINLDRLKVVEEQLGKHYVARIGILGEKSRSRKETVETKAGVRKAGKEPSTLTNADIGLVHEKGSLSRGIPRRSFLMMPLELKLSQYVAVIGLDIFKGVTVENIKVAYTKMGIMAEGIIQRAFATGGYGKWAPNKPSTVRRKKSDSPLIDTAQLRKSISSTVVTA